MMTGCVCRYRIDSTCDLYIIKIIQPFLKKYFSVIQLAIQYSYMNTKMYTCIDALYKVTDFVTHNTSLATPYCRPFHGKSQCPLTAPVAGNVVLT